MYEVNVRQYSEEGTFAEVNKALPAIKAMGTDIVWLMPIHPIGEKNRKGPLGSYYSISDYKGINPEFGNAADLHALVDHAHKMGMHVIIDWVANHTAWDHHWAKTNPEFYNHDAEGNFVPPVPDWHDVIDLNYDNAEMRLAMIDAMAYWLTEFDIDGFRCDVAEEVPSDFWKQATEALREIKPIIMLAEGQKPELHANGFNITYGWYQIGKLREIAKGNQNATDIQAHESWERSTEYPEDAIRLKFITNHDENSWNGTVQEDFGDAADVMMAWAVLSRGMPLVYTGQETDLDRRLEFFEKDTIQWDMNHPKRAFLTKLLNLKKENKALWNGVYGGDLQLVPIEGSNPAVYTFKREKDGDRVVAVLNLSKDRQRICLNDSSIAGKYTEVMGGRSVTLNGNDRMQLKPWGFHIFAASAE